MWWWTLILSLQCHILQENPGPWCSVGRQVSELSTHTLHSADLGPPAGPCVAATPLQLRNGPRIYTPCSVGLIVASDDCMYGFHSELIALVKLALHPRHIQPKSYVRRMKKPFKLILFLILEYIGCSYSHQSVKAPKGLNYNHPLTVSWLNVSGLYFLYFPFVWFL